MDSPGRSPGAAAFLSPDGTPGPNTGVALVAPGSILLVSGAATGCGMERKLALFIDFENIARGVRQRHLEERVDLRAILSELEGKGRILLKRAYADWGCYRDYRSDLLQHGIEPVQVFAASRERDNCASRGGWKNGADIRIAIDAIEAVFRFPEVTDFVLVTGDSDFLSLVNRLRENGKTVWGLGLKAGSSQYLVKSCDHFHFYEDIADWLPEEHTDVNGGARRDGRSLLLTTVRRMADRQGLPGMPPPGTPLKITAVKTAMQRLDPVWDERFEGHASFLDFLRAHADLVACSQPAEGREHYVAERGTVAEANLERLHDSSGPTAPEACEELVAAVRKALRELGGGGDGEPQRYPVRGTHVKLRLRQDQPGFEEGALGFASFLDLLLSMREHFRIVRGEPRGDVLIAERGSPADHSLNGAPDAAANGNGHWLQTPQQRYLGALRIRRIRHVPMSDRHAVIRQLCALFEASAERREELTLKEAKDRLHQWFEEHDPSVPWESVNNVVYHLFWTYCFEFGEGPEDVPLWDRPTCWSGGMRTPEDVIRRCDVGLVRMISEVGQ